MKILYLFGIAVAGLLMFLYEWPKLQHKKKEKAAFTTLTLIGCMLAVLLLYYPELPGPTQLVDAVYKPLGKLLEK